MIVELEPTTSLDAPISLWVCCDLDESCEALGEPCTERCGLKTFTSAHAAIDALSFVCWECDRDIESAQYENWRISPRYRRNGNRLSAFCSHLCQRRYDAARRHRRYRKRLLAGLIRRAWGERAEVLRLDFGRPGEVKGDGCFDAYATVALADSNLEITLWMGDVSTAWLRAAQFAEPRPPYGNQWDADLDAQLAAALGRWQRGEAARWRRAARKMLARLEKTNKGAT